MKWINIFFVLLLSSVGLQAQSPEEIWFDDFNDYPTPNVTYSCDFHNHLNITQMNGLYGSSHGSVSYLDEFKVYSQTLMASFEDGKGIVMNSCGASRGEGLFFNIPGGIKANTCYRVSFDLSFATPYGLSESDTDLVFRLALGNDFTDTDLGDLIDCCSAAPTEPQITLVDDVILADLETLEDEPDTWEVAKNFYRIEMFINQGSDFDQLLFFPQDIIATPAGGTKHYITMFDNLSVEVYCPELKLFENRLFIPAGEHRAENIISRTTSVAPPSADNNINPNLSTSFIASKEVLLSPRTTVSLNLASNQFLATIEPCLLDNGCFGSSTLRLDDQPIEKVFDNKELRIFPNPAKDRLYIETGNLDAIKNVQIIDAQGVYHSDIRMINNGYQIELKVDKLSPGVYFLRLTNEDQVVTKSFVISR